MSYLQFLACDKAVEARETNMITSGAIAIMVATGFVPIVVITTREQAPTVTTRKVVLLQAKNQLNRGRNC